MKYFTYMILFQNGFLYTGCSGNLERRTVEHRKDVGKGAKVVWKEVFGTREEALAREKQLKGWSRRKKEALYQGQLATLKHLAKRRGGRPLPPPLAPPWRASLP